MVAALSICKSVIECCHVYSCCVKIMVVVGIGLNICCKFVVIFYAFIYYDNNNNWITCIMYCWCITNMSLYKYKIRKKEKNEQEKVKNLILIQPALQIGKIILPN